MTCRTVDGGVSYDTVETSVEECFSQEQFEFKQNILTCKLGIQTPQVVQIVVRYVIDVQGRFIIVLHCDHATCPTSFNITHFHSGRFIYRPIYLQAHSRPNIKLIIMVQVK